MSEILVAVDFSEVTADLLKIATRLSDALAARLWLVHVVPPDPDFVGFDVGPDTVREQVARKYREQHREIQELAGQIRSQGRQVEALLLQGPTVKTLLDEADDIAAELIVIGSHGKGTLEKALLGSVSEGVVRHSSRPVLVIPSRRESLRDAG